MWTRRLADADASCGGKAYGLARMIKRGLRVPEGFVVEDRAFRVALGELAHPAQRTEGVGVAEAPQRIESVGHGVADAQRIESVGHVPAEAQRIDSVGHELAAAAQRIERAELPLELVHEVESAGRALGGRLAVRSSASIEDGEVGAAAGVFSSRTAVAIEDLWPAIRAVWTSALTPLAASYARYRGTSKLAIHVIVQRFVDGEPVIVYTRPPGNPTADDMLIQRGGRLLRVPRAKGSFVLAAEVALSTDRGVDAELVVPRRHANESLVDDAIRATDGASTPPHGNELADLEHAWFVQARPIVHPVVKPRIAPPPMVLAPLQDGRVWKLDVTHNPDPLSPAQAGLVERVERAGATPWSSRVCAGYLYTTPRESIAVTAAESVDELRARVEQIERRLGAALDPTTAPPQPPAAGDALESVLDRYVAFCRIWSYELGPLIAASRGARPVGVGRRASAAESALFAAARGRADEATVIALLGVLAPAWDVAVPTFHEQPGRVRDAIARLSFADAVEPSTTTSDSVTALAPKRTTKRLQAAVPVGPSTASTQRVQPAVSALDPSTAILEYMTLLDSLTAAQPSNLADAVADLAERDDYWFAIAQWTVRRAIAERAHELGISTEDAFWLPLDELVAGGIEPVDASRRASGARAAAARATSWNMPMVVGPNASTTESGVALRGIGFGPSVTGRVRRFDSLASAIVVGRGDIVVTRAVTPALAVIVVGCAAIVSETGGLLDHGAAMARELGIPCVVGCRDAWSRLADGMIVTVDNGTVVPIASDQT